MTILRKRGGRILRRSGGLAGHSRCCCTFYEDCHTQCDYKFGTPEADDVLLHLTMLDGTFCPDIEYLLLGRGQLTEFGPYLDCNDLPPTPGGEGSWGLQCYWVWHVYCYEFALPGAPIDFNNSIGVQFSIASYVWNLDTSPTPTKWWAPSAAVVLVKGGYLSSCPSIYQGETNFLNGAITTSCPPLSGVLTPSGCRYDHCVASITYTVGGSIP